MHSLFSFFFPPSSHLRHQLGFELLDPCKLFLHLARELNLGHGPRLECLLQPFHLIELLEIIKMDVRWRRVNKHGKQVTVIVRGAFGKHAVQVQGTACFGGSGSMVHGDIDRLGEAVPRFQFRFPIGIGTPGVVAASSQTCARTCQCTAPSTNASTLVRPPAEGQPSASIERILAPARKMGRGAADDR